jgi:3-hydroxyacyl-[acyl-carrier-protein] dehydratase
MGTPIFCLLNRKTLLMMTTLPTTEALPTLDILDIQRYIPHRPPFLLIDRVTEHQQGVFIVGYKNTSINEDFFKGHFPHLPIMPGVLQIEALAQLGGVMVAHLPEGEGKLGLFAGLDNVRFRRMVVPGDRLDLRAELVQCRRSIVKIKGVASVDGQVSVEADMMFSFIPKPE